LYKDSFSVSQFLLFNSGVCVISNKYYIIAASTVKTSAEKHYANLADLITIRVR